MPNTRIRNVTPNVRRINDLPNIRVSSKSVTPSSNTFTVIGVPIGLLLTLTYAEKFTILGSSDFFRPHIDIRNT